MGHWTNTCLPEIYEPHGSYISGYTNPGYDFLAIDINEEYLAEILGDYFSVALAKAVQGEEENPSVTELGKYQDLQADIVDILRAVKRSRLSQAETITRHIFWGREGVDIKCLDEKLYPWCTVVKYLWIAFMVIFKEMCMNQDKFPFAQGGW